MKSEEGLDRFEAQVGLGKARSSSSMDDEIDNLLNLEPEQIRRMSTIECAESAYILDEFAFHLQRALNKNQSLANWAEARINRIIAPLLSTMPGYSPSERNQQAVYSNDAARETQTIRISAQLKADRLSYLAGRVSSLATRMGDLSFVKRVRQ